METGKLREPLVSSLPPVTRIKSKPRWEAHNIQQQWRKEKFQGACILVSYFVKS
jgi:hypothetical protein